MLQRKPAFVLLAYLLLRGFYVLSRLVFRLEVQNSEVLTRLQPPFVICPNHQSYLDPVFVDCLYPYRVLKLIFHIGAKEYWENWFTAWVARLLNIVPIDSDLQLIPAMKCAAAGLHIGKILNIYPEGIRSFDGHLLEFKKGPAILAVETGVSIVPVAIDGVYKVLPRKSGWLRPAKVKIRFGEPLSVQEAIAGGLDNEAAYDRLTSMLKESIANMLETMRRPE